MGLFSDECAPPSDTQVILNRISDLEEILREVLKKTNIIEIRVNDLKKGIILGGKRS